MDYFWIWIYVALVAGGVGGFFLCAILNAKKDRGIFTVDNVVKWLKTCPDKGIYLIVRWVYDSKRTIHKNPIRKKPAEKYPASER